VAAAAIEELDVSDAIRARDETPADRAEAVDALRERLLGRLEALT
jgi:hypothetical protein